MAGEASQLGALSITGLGGQDHINVCHKWEKDRGIAVIAIVAPAGFFEAIQMISSDHS